MTEKSRNYHTVVWMLNRYESLSKQCEIQCSITMRFQWIEVSETLTQISPPFASQIIMKCNLHLNNNIMMKIIIIFWQINYRPGQLNWEYAMWKFQDFYATQILREINFGHFEDPKNCRFDHLSSSELWIFGKFWHFQEWNTISKNQTSKPRKLSKWYFFTLWK